MEDEFVDEVDPFHRFKIMADLNHSRSLLSYPIMTEKAYEN